MKKIFCAVFIYSLFLSCSFADTVILKGGCRIKGNIIERTNDRVKIEINGRQFTYFTYEIEGAEQDAAINKDLTAPSVKDKQQAAIISTDQIIQKFKEANNKLILKRRRIKETLSTEIGSLLSLKSEQTSNFDFNSEIVYIRTEIKDFNINLSEATQGFMQRAKLRGASGADIQAMQQTLDGIKKSTAAMANKVKGQAFEFYYAGNNQYLNLKDKWFKLKNEKLAQMWQAFRQVKDDKSRLEAIRKLTEVCAPPNIQQATFCFSDNFLQQLTEATNEVKSVKEGTFLGKPCFILEIDSGAMVELIKKLILQQVSDKGQAISKAITYNAVEIKEFISKEDYLLLGTSFLVDMVFYDPAKSATPMRQVTKEEVAIEYPSEKLTLPDALSEAVEVKNEEEFRNILKKEMSDLLGYPGRA